jgi:RNA polymerase sigma-70 factor (ECF subfamily)
LPGSLYYKGRADGRLALLAILMMALETADAGGDVPRRMERRDARALAQLYDRYGRLAYALILRIVRNPAAAEDLVQETFLRVWNRAPSFDPRKSAVGPWLLAVARNRAIDYVRSQEGRDSRPAVFERSEDPRLDAGLGTGVSFAEQARRVKQALAQLPENQRQVIELACFDGLSQTGMAAKLGQQPDTVKISVRGALAELRKAMDAGVAE